MNTRAKFMGLAALPLAGLLATGGAALAQTAGTPASTQVVQQAAVHRAGDPCPQHAVKAVAQQVRDRDRDGNCDHPAQATRTTAVTTAHSHHDGNCAGHGDHGDQ